jgi:hypothetical protein
MTTVDEIKRALRRITTEEQQEVIEWLESYGGAQPSGCRIEEPRTADTPAPPRVIDEKTR